MQKPLYIKNYTTPTDTDADYYLPSNELSFKTQGLSEIVLVTHREEETGTCTLQGFFEFLFVPDNEWYPWLDSNDATQIQTVQYANSEVDTSTPYHRYTVIKRPTLIDGTNANRVELVNTVHKIYMAHFPDYIRVRFRVGGTSVSTVFSAQLGGN